MPMRAIPPEHDRTGRRVAGGVDDDGYSVVQAVIGDRCGRVDLCLGKATERREMPSLS